MLAGTRRTFNEKIVTVVVVEFLDALYDEKIDRKPDRSAPVGVAAEQACAGLTRLVAHLVDRTVQFQPIGMLLVVPADRTDAIVAQELLGIQHAFEQTLHAVTADKCQEPAFADAWFLPAGHQ